MMDVVVVVVIVDCRVYRNMPEPRVLTALLCDCLLFNCILRQYMRFQRKWRKKIRLNLLAI